MDGLEVAPGIGPGVAAALMATSLATSAITASFGLGGGVALLALLATLLPPAALIPVHGAVQLGSNVGRAMLMARDVHWPALTGFAGGAAAGAAAGGLAAAPLPDSAVRIGVGVFILWSLLARPPAALARSGPLMGAASSFLTMFFGATGPFVAAWVRTLRLGRVSMVATQAAMMTLQHLLKTVTFALLGFAFAPWAGLIGGMIALGAVGTVIGRRILLRIDERIFARGLNLILALLALRLIWSGTAAALAP